MPVSSFMDPNPQSACSAHVKLPYPIPGMLEERAVKLRYQGRVWIVFCSGDDHEGRMLTGLDSVHERDSNRVHPLRSYTSVPRVDGSYKRLTHKLTEVGRLEQVGVRM